MRIDKKKLIIIGFVSLVLAISSYFLYTHETAPSCFMPGCAGGVEERGFPVPLSFYQNVDWNPGHVGWPALSWFGLAVFVIDFFFYYVVVLLVLYLINKLIASMRKIHNKNHINK